MNNGTKRVHYHTEVLESADQVRSMANYLRMHGFECFNDDDESVSIPVVAENEHQAGGIEKRIHMLVWSWTLFWENSDKGVLGLPIYEKSSCPQ